MLAPGICNAPEWYGHGSIFIFKFESDEWLEVDCEKKTVTGTWKRTGDEGLPQP